VVKIESLDHVALWVADRDELADFMTANLGMHVIERTDAFTIVGADARRGKLTLFAVDDRREPGPLERVVLRVSDLSAALGRLPAEIDVQRQDGMARFSAPGGLELGLVEADGVEYDLDHVVLRASDPKRSFAELSELGFAAEDGRLRAGEAWIELTPREGENPETSLFNHLGLRVDSAGEHIQEARQRGIEIADIVDAANTLAVFVWGPERIKLEYVEHKASFSLV
jgi:catechol 2,3-dioxygenase-like lactoylglutathione lyase family enzyme